MNKIHLAEYVKGGPLCKDSPMNKKTRSLSENIKELCNQSGLSYIEKNQALYLADKELYEETIRRQN